MASYLRPRRGKRATAVAQLTSSAPLKRGEVFFEVPDAGTGTGAGRIKMGDGSTAYESLPYFLEPFDPNSATVGFTNSTAAESDPYTTNATHTNAIVPSANLKTILTNLKQLLLNYNSQFTKLNNDLTQTNQSLSNVNSNLTLYSEGAFIRSSGNITANSLKRCGNMLNGVLCILDNTVAPYTSIAVIPDGFRPKHDKYAMGGFSIANDSNSWVTIPIKISTTGAVTCPFIQSTTKPVAIYLAFEINLG